MQSPGYKHHPIEPSCIGHLDKDAKEVSLTIAFYVHDFLSRCSVLVKYMESDPVSDNCASFIVHYFPSSNHLPRSDYYCLAYCCLSQ